MSYSTLTDLRKLLPAKITIGDTNIGTPVPGRQGVNRSTITEEDAKYFLKYATQYIDSRLSPLYYVPLRRIKSFETKLSNDIIAGTSVLINVRDAGSFAISDTIRFQTDCDSEIATIISTNATSEYVTSFTIDTISLDYSEGDFVSIIEYPDPIPIMSARFAVASLFDRLFVAEQETDISEYGTEQRNMARNDMDSIFNGSIILVGQELTGRRFVRGSLLDGYYSPLRTEVGKTNQFKL